MCLYFFTKRVGGIHEHLETAAKGISAYKIVHKDNRSMYMKFVYSENTSYKTDMNAEQYDKTLAKVSAGFHAFRNKPIHLDLPYDDNDYKIVKMTIPKGAHYYLGIHGDVVSDTINAGTLRSLKPAPVQF